MNHPNLHLLRDAGENTDDSNFALNVLSVFDEENWTGLSSYDRVNIACTTRFNFKLFNRYWMGNGGHRS